MTRVVTDVPDRQRAVDAPRDLDAPARDDRRRLLRTGWGLALGAITGWASSTLAATTPSRPHHDLAWRETALPAFGTTVWLRAAHHDAAHVGAALSAAAQRIQAVEGQMSLFRADSAITRLNLEGRLDNAPIELVAVLRESLRIARATGGLFDPTVQPLWRLRFDAAREGREPSPQDIARARRLVDWRQIHIQTEGTARGAHGASRRHDPRRHTIRLARPGMALTLNGIAQGWATDAAARVLREHSIEHALIDAGEWQPMGRSPDGTPWRLGVQDPRDAQRILTTLTADGRAIACSADDKLAFTSDHREHHILDPRTGHSPRELACVVVLAPTCTLADALTKPLMMGSASDALRLARAWGVDVVAVDKRGRTSTSMA